MSETQNQVTLPIPSSSSEMNQNQIEKVFPISVIKLCSFLQLFCAGAVCLLQVSIIQKSNFRTYSKNIFPRFGYSPWVTVSSAMGMVEPDCISACFLVLLAGLDF